MEHRPIPVFRPPLDVKSILAELRDTLESGWIGQGPKVEQFEVACARFLNVKHFVATSSGTAALHLAIHCVVSRHKNARQSVLTSPITFVSTNAAIAYCNLRPVFGVVDPRSGNLLPQNVHGSFGAAIITHIGGYPCDMDAINEAAARYDVPVIEDCAHAFGAMYRDKAVGDTNNTCCWSFHAVKNLPTGDGGGVSTNDDALAERLRRLRWMGIDRSTHARSADGYSTGYDIPELGFKYHMNDLTACLGLVGLRSEPIYARQRGFGRSVIGHSGITANNIRRVQILQRYVDAFPGRMARIRGNLVGEASPVYYSTQTSGHFAPIFVESPAMVGLHLASKGIATTRHYLPNYYYRPFAACEMLDGARQAAEEYYDHALVLPCFPELSREDQDRVISAVKETI